MINEGTIARFKGIDLSSDTATRPTVAMKKAIMDAELGDEQKGEDPTTRKLEEMTAKLLGQGSAVFFPSATMANQVAIRLFCDRGDEVFAAEKSHIFHSEGGGPAIHSGVMPRPIPTKTGIFTGEQLKAAQTWSKGFHHSRPKLVSIENTTNIGGGLAWDSNVLNDVLSTAKTLNLKTHLDGARLFNAAIKTGWKPSEIASKFDVVTVCLSKGLGCPMGALLAFDSMHYETVRRLKHLFGGALRQSGMMAAAGIYALEHNIERLKEDHENASLLADKLESEIPDIRIEKNPLSTNMVFFEWVGKSMTPTQFYARCREKGVRFSQMGENRFRAVMHLDVKRDDIYRVVEVLRQIQSPATVSELTYSIKPKL